MYWTLNPLCDAGTVWLPPPKDMVYVPPCFTIGGTVTLNPSEIEL